MSDINKFTTKEVLNKVLLDSSGNAVNAFSHTTQEAFNAALDDDNSRLNVNLVGGTIGGDVTINGDLTVNGDGAGAYDEIVNGELHVKITETNAFLVEKADGTDVFVVDTTNSKTTLNSELQITSTGVAHSPALAIDNSSASTFIHSAEIFAGSMTANQTNSIFIGRIGSTKNSAQIGFKYSSAGSNSNLLTLGHWGVNESLVIDGSGNIGIGTSSPVAQGLTVANAGDVNLTLLADSDANGANNWPMIDFRVDNTSGNPEARIYYKQDVASLILATANTSALTIDSSQNATFGGDINMTADKFLNVGGSVSKNSNIGSTANGITIQDANAPTLSLWATSNAGYHSHLYQITSNFGIRSSGSISFNVNGASNEALFLNTNKDATFGGSVNVPANQKINIGGGNGIGALNVRQADGSNSRRNIVLDSGGSAQDWSFGTVTESNRVNFVLSKEYGNNSWDDALKVYNADGKFEFLGGGGATFAGDVFIKNSGSNDPATLSLWSSDTSIADDDNIGVILAQGSDSGGSPPYTGAKIEFNADATWDTGTTHYYATRIDFFTQSNSGADTLANPALTIDSSQNATFAGTIASVTAITDGIGLNIESNSLTTGNVGRFYSDSSNTSARNLVEITNDHTGASGTTALRVRQDAPHTAIDIDSANTGDWAVDIQGTAHTTAGLLYAYSNSSSNATRNLVEIHNDHASATGATALKIIQDSTGNALHINAGGNDVFKLDSNSRISLSNNDSGTSNTVFGKLAGASIDAGSNYNTFIGENVADASLNDATDNIGVGYYALSSLTTGDNNVVMGSSAGINITGTSSTVLLGHQAGNAINSADAVGTVAVGYQSLKAITNGGKNVAVGYLAGSQITTGDSNVALGHQAMDEIKSGDRNIAIGHNAIGNAQGGDTSGGSKDNIAIGFQSQGGGWADAECLKNTSIGNYSLDGALNAALQNTAIGYASLGAVTQGDNNVAVGMEAGDNITTGTKNVTIGQQARTSAVGGTNQIVIGATATGVADNSVTLGNSSVTDVYIAPGQTSEQAIVFRDSVDAGKIVYSHSNEQIQFRVGGTGGDSIKARIRTGGDLYLDGGQITFPGTQVPSSDANTLDDYEEGDWTPTLTTNGTDFGSVTYDSLTGGRYTKIGNVVHFQGFLRTDAVTVGSASNDTAIGGLPFTAIASNGGKVDGQSAMNIGTVSGWAGENPSHGMVMGNTSFIQIYYMDYNVDAVNIASGSDVTAGTSADKNAIYFSGTYISS